ncbi:MAG: VCBS repeat-containing protein, partial [Deltaproteobacteria bacterium]|nr:VCBS repeat-containing protein [Deltaproteobacteria bacterium]
MRARTLLLGLWVLAGCDCGGGGLVGEPCTVAEDCDGLLTCRDGACAELCDDDRAACGAICCQVGEVCGLTGLCETPDACTAAGGVPCGGACCQGDQICRSGMCEASCPTTLCGTNYCCEADEVCLGGAGCCAPAAVCGEECCGAGEVCDLGVCRMDCGGGVPACGADNLCCTGDEVCYQGTCLVPGDACVPGAACATRPEERVCPDGQICDPGLMRCVPQAVNEDCTYIPPAGVFDPVPLFTWGQRRPRTCNSDAQCQKAEVCQGGMCQVTWPHVTPAAGDMPEHFQVTSIPMVADLDGDCVPEIVFNTYAASNFTADGVLRAIRGDDGSKVWTVSDSAYRTDATGNPAIGDVDGDGTPEVFVVGPQKNVLCINGDGTPRWISDPFTETEGSGSVTLANMDGLGNAEVIFGAAVFDSAGHLLFEGGAGIGIAGQGPISCVADLDGDGRPELVAGRTVYETSGTVAGGDFAGAERVSAATADGYCGVADLDADQIPEVVLVTGGIVYVLQGQTMAVLAQATLPGGGNGGAPNIADFDGDGRPDIGTAGAQNYVVLRYLGEGQLEILWQAPTEDDSSSRTGSSVFDFDGDGR